jgi:hypothetical protein
MRAEVLKLPHRFACWTELFEASDDPERQDVAFTELTDRGPGWFDARAGHDPRTKQNRPTGTGALRVRAAADFVKKVEA